MSSAPIAEGVGPIEEAMHKKLKSVLQPIHLELRNESYMHNVPKGSETHFKVVIVSPQFEGKQLIQVSGIISLKYRLEKYI